VDQYAVNLGLALGRAPVLARAGEAVAPLPVINLLPRRRRPWYLSPRYAAMAVALVVVLAGLQSLYQVTSATMGETRQLRQQMDLVDLRLEQIRKQNAARGQLQKQLEEYRGLTLDRAVVTGYLNVLEENRPADVELNSISFADKGMTLQVSAAAWEQAEAYTEALRETGHFAEVSLPSEGGIEGEEGTISFGIEAEFPKEGPRLIK
jgi:Tfp pilus assembly protein PilN